MACLLFSLAGISYFKSLFSIAKLQVPEGSESMIAYVNSYYPYVEALLFGFSFGTLFYWIYWLTEKTRLRQKSIGTIVLVHSLLYSVAFCLVFVMLAFIVVEFQFFPVDDFAHFMELLGNNSSVISTFVIYILVVIVVTNCFLEIRKKFGPGNLWKLLIGKYHVPVAENRIFMFLDLKDSTGYAEKLGHISYSQLIQDCFGYLNNILDDHDAQIYQYVGDEVVLTWDMDNPLSVENSIAFFYSYQRLLHRKRDRFMVKYGFVPEFKAGINQGRVTVAEVGNIKREIAYHGDVLNTGARIQSICNEFKKSLLVSETFAARMNTIDHFKKEFVAHLNLRGKSKAIDIFSVEPI